MAEERPKFTRSSGTRIEIADDGIATLSYGEGTIRRVTTVPDLIAEWRTIGRAIAAWEDSHAGKLRRFPEAPRIAEVWPRRGRDEDEDEGEGGGGNGH